MQRNTTHHSSLYWFLLDSQILIKRSLTHIFRHLDQLMGLTIMPIMFLLLFRYVFGGAIATEGTTYVNFLVAGILVQMAAFGATTTSFSIATDLQKGLMDRFKSLPMASSSVLMGHVVADLVRNTLSSFVLIIVGLLVGFRPEASVYDWLAIFALTLLFTFAISWMSVILGLLAKSIEAVQQLSFLIVFPLTFASAAFAPTETMPTWLRIFAENQPVTQVIEAIRALMIGENPDTHLYLSIIWFVGITVISIPIASYLFRRKQAA